MAFYKKRVVRRDTEADIAERTRYREAAARALVELQERFPTITAENFAEADRFRETRTQELLADLAPGAAHA